MGRYIILSLIVLGLVAPTLFLLAAMEPAPIVDHRPASNADDAARTRALFREFRAVTEATEHKLLRLTEADMNSVMAFSMRAVPVLRGRAIVRPHSLHLHFSADATRIPGGGWLNLRLVIAPSHAGLQLESVALGPVSIPAGLVLPALAAGLDLVLGDGLGQVAIKSIDGVAMNDREVVVGVGLDRASRKALAQRAKQTARAAADISRPEDVRVYYLALQAAVGDGRLQPRGSVVPYLRFAMEKAHRQALQDGRPNAIKAALLALAIYCGHQKFQSVVGDVVSSWSTPPQPACAKATLLGRGDLRQHFTISAGLKAAGDAGIAFTIGEFKELLDSNKGGSGFSFDDLAADRAGIRFASVLLDAGPEQRARMLEAMVSDRAIAPRVHDLPSGLSRLEFERRFGDVDSAAYKAILSEIDNRIDMLAVFARR